MTDANAQSKEHPSPHRSRAGLLGLIYGLTAAPSAWIVSQVANSTLAQEACFPGVEPLSAPAFNGVHAVQTVILLAAILVSASAIWVTQGTWRSTQYEQAGDRHALLSIGEGRSRFMAFAGLLTSVGFLVASLFSIPALILVRAC